MFNLLDFFKKFTSSIEVFKKPTISVLGIDIGSSSIKVVQLKKKGGKAVLETYGELALGPYAGSEVGKATSLSSDKISEALMDLLKEANTTTKQCGVAIPIGSSLVKLIEIPPVGAKELNELIPLEARKYIPVPISEVSLDWWVIPKAEAETFEGEGARKAPEKLETLIVAIHNEVISKYQEIIKKTGLESGFVEIEIFSVIRSVLSQEMSSVMIFDMGAASTKLYIVERGVVKNSHTINRGSQDITIALSASLGISILEAEEIKRGLNIRRDLEQKIKEIISLNLDFIFSETNQVIFGYQKKYNKNISKVVLTGGGVSLNNFLSLARANLQTEVVFGNPFSKVEFPAFLEDVLRVNGPEFSVAIGVALRRFQEAE